MTKYEIQEEITKLELWLDVAVTLKKESLSKKYRIKIEEFKKELKG